MKPIDLYTKIKLNNGVEIPYIGLGTYNIRSQKEVDRAIHSALEVGYRLIDTAAAYYNEKEIGKALKNSSVPREEIFITTKLDNPDHGYQHALKAFDESLRKLDCGYIDLYLIHWPVQKRNESWKAMEELLNMNKCHAIGVCNYTDRHLKESHGNSSTLPAINQVEFNPFVFPKEIYDYCNSNNIVVEAYTPIARNRKSDHPVIKELSGKYKKTPAQIMLRWSLQHKAIVIPKSSNPDRIKENSDIFNFNISDEDMSKLNSLNEYLRFSADPDNYK
jgi:diketogulonate reductase-like aldo/keto reductase